MSNKRKIIFKEALFNVPFLLIITAATLLFMLFSGRNAYDIEQLIKQNMHSDPSLDVSSFMTTGSKSYKIAYYYGDKSNKVKYADFQYKGKGDAPESILTLYEARDGLESGIYSLVWFYDEQFVTYMPLNSNSESESFEKYPAAENPAMYEIIKSYSWEGAMLSGGASDNSANGYKLAGLRMYTWNTGNEDDLRECFLWTIGGNAREMYSFIPGEQGEYREINFKR